MNFLEKLDYLMNRNDLNKNSLSKACNIPYTTIDGWYKKGYEGLKLTTLRKLANYFETSLDFWANDRDAQESLSQPQHHNSEKFLDQKSIVISDINEKEHIKKYRALDERGKDTVDIMLNAQYELASASKQSSSYDNTVPLRKVAEEQPPYNMHILSRKIDA